MNGVDRIAPDVRDRILVAWLHAAPVRVGESSASLDLEFRETAEALARDHAGRKPSEVPELQPARDLYRALGVDPTRTRPSSEALFRRAVKRQPLPRVLNAVDLANLCSLRFLLSIGLYDADRVRGAVEIRTGGAGDSYPGIRRGEIHLAGRLALFDDEGPFGNPTADSLRTAVTHATRALLMVIFAPADYPRSRMDSHVRLAAGRIERYLTPAGETCRIATGVVGLSGR